MLFWTPCIANGRIVVFLTCSFLLGTGFPNPVLRRINSVWSVGLQQKGCCVSRILPLPQTNEGQTALFKDAVRTAQ